ncbi:error-prone DNA polymerase [Glycomyces algeriensis]|uniref:Error-prone DNA polymerase n=1 Tax=Glycomyces algeriensis TaxID=256037 RepID=A0A9W6GAK4_9ACTN|nr:error-prone DNA polymerase [Glycomyces algeriensis]MDA1364645.1 error-prone DNA polymerase [Glycomyces algeriensis]MDR7350682.1 error-prone DNA polymerase [Glycomyces algeriensis]GLI43391.1 error-prone DNA polymerase [Glycomyces algeriensis]
MTDYAELHCHSHYSFADGADAPAALAAEAARLGLKGLAITDHDGLYAIPQFDSAAARFELPSVFGAELNLDLTRARRGQVDPAGRHLVVLARDPDGYRALSRAITAAKLEGGEKDRPRYSLASLGAHANGGWQILTGCRKGFLNAALDAGGPDAAEDALRELADAFGREHLAVELTCHDLPGDTERIETLAALARRFGVPVVATNNVHYAAPNRARTAAALAAIRARSTLEATDPHLPANAGAHLRSGEEMAQRFADFPAALEESVRIATECAFRLKLLAPRLPHFPVPAGHDDHSYLRMLTDEGGAVRYGPRGRERVAGAWDQIERELQVIGELEFSGYFLIVADIVRFCREHDIYCQGRGSAANSAVCYALGITRVDAVAYGMLFERFLSSDRDGPPDIDLDIESGRREEVIQYVYEKYGRDRAALVANVVTYRPRSAVRDAAKALGYGPDQALAWSKRLHRWGSVDPAEAEGIPADVQALAGDLVNMPQHLGIHPGGMVLTEQPVSEIVPVEPARMKDRTVLQWDKEDCADAHLVKFDLLGLGMLEALHRMVDLIGDFHGDAVDLALIDLNERVVYEMLQRADTVGVFQVESRAQMATLPRLKPEVFYDLVVEVALIRPGPIQGDSVHPYLRRRHGEPWEHLVPEKLMPALKKTLGVPLFQEQLMQIAIDAAGFDGGEADKLRRAMGAKRSAEKMEELRLRLYKGMAANGITGAQADQVYEQLKSFADFGFPESHSASFAHLVYSSAWIKCHYPAAFYAGLLASQPMGFYSPASLIADAQRHGLTVLAPDVNASEAVASLIPSGRERRAPILGEADLRLGLDNVKGLGEAAALRIVAERGQDGPFESLADLARRTGLGKERMEKLAVAGAFESLEPDRRKALWAAGTVDERPGTIPGTGPAAPPPTLPGMSGAELARADYTGLGLSVQTHPMELVRASLDAAGILPAARLPFAEDGTRIEVAGIVTHRQRPSTAKGVTFLSLEDETGIANIVCSQGLWKRWQSVASVARALVIRGAVEKPHDAPGDVMPMIVADKLTLLDLNGPSAPSRDFR